MAVLVNSNRAGPVGQPFFRRAIAMLSARRWLVALLLASSGLFRCGSPRRGDETSSSTVDTATNFNKSDSLVQVCMEPAAPRPLGPDSLDLVAGLMGTYRLTMISTQGNRSGSTANGLMYLRRPDSSHAIFTPRQDLPAHAVRILAIGWTDIDLSAVGDVHLAHSASSQDPEQPGLQMIAALRFVAGNSLGKRGPTTDSGVFFEITLIDSGSFKGVWADAGLRLHAPSGYFCATRVN